MLTLRSITPSITSLACTRVILALRGLFLHSDTESPPTLPPYHNSGTHRKDLLGSPRRRNRRNLPFDPLVSDPRGATGRSTSVGVYDLTTFGNTTVGIEVSSFAGFAGGPPSAPSAQNAYGASTSIHDRQPVSLISGHYTPPTATFPHRGIQGKLEEGRGEGEGQS
jgi:hypothetical protein